MQILIKTFSLAMLVFTSNVIFAQEDRFFMPLEISNAYENGTRSWNGEPGENYWHNTVNYKMNVTVNPEDRSVSGSQEVTYFNNSPDALTTLVIRLYYNVFKKGNTRLTAVKEEDLSDGVELSDFKVNGEGLSLATRQLRISGTNLLVQLKEPLESGNSLTFSCNWQQKVPLTIRRTGAIDSTSFFIAYWYPQVSVYDDVFGWDRMNYTFRTEFYNNLGNYDVTINVPDNFTVWATGELQNATDVLNKKVFKKYKKAHSSEETINLISSEDLAAEFKHNSGTWHYIATEVSDFAFAMSDHYMWDAASQKVEDRQVFVSTAFPIAQQEAFAKAKITQVQRKTMIHFSEDVPGIPYPYPAFTTFIGLRGGGMEFPMMANNDGPSQGVTIHEMFHTYFPMYVRTNERRFAWMDEGWADFNTSKVTNLFFKENDLPPYAGPKTSMQSTIGTFSDLPLYVSSQYMDNSNYGYSSYPLPSFVYGTLNDLLGEELFLKCYRTYIKRWAKKSPTPYDFFYTFEDVSGKDLGWFWKPWFFEFGYPEVGISQMDGNKITIKNSGTKPAPLTLDIVYKDDTKKNYSKGADIWTNQREVTLEIENVEEVKILILNKQIPDFNPLDNYYPTLDKIYAAYDMPKDALGAYAIDQFPVTATLSQKEGAFYLEISGTPISTYLLPESETSFVSLDGSLKMVFVVEDNQVTGMNINVFGFAITSKKK